MRCQHAIRLDFGPSNYKQKLMLSTSHFELCENENGSCAENINLCLLVCIINNEIVWKFTLLLKKQQQNNIFMIHLYHNNIII